MKEKKKLYMCTSFLLPAAKGSIKIEWSRSDDTRDDWRARLNLINARARAYVYMDTSLAAFSLRTHRTKSEVGGGGGEGNNGSRNGPFRARESSILLRPFRESGYFFSFRRHIFHRRPASSYELYPIPRAPNLDNNFSHTYDAAAAEWFTVTGEVSIW